MTSFSLPARRFRAATAILAGAIATLLAAPSSRAANTVWNLAGSGVWDVATPNWTGGVPTPNLFANGDHATFNNPAGGTITLSGSIAPGSTTVNSSGNYTLTGTPITTGSLTKSGSGTLTLNANNTYTGATVISGGTLKLSAALSPVGGSRLWLDAADATSLVTAGNAVSQWTDKSGNGFNVTQAGGADMPTTGAITINGRNALNFDGSDYFSRSFAASGALPLAANDDSYTYFAVWRPAVVGVMDVYEQNAGASAGGQRSAILAVNDRYGFNGEGNDRHDLVQYAANTLRITSLEINNDLFDGFNNLRIFDNGTQYLGRTGDPGGLNVGAGGIGVGVKYSNFGERMNGALAEILVYDSILSPTDRQSVQDYLNNKWAGGPAVANVLPADTALSITTSGATFDLSGTSQVIGSLAGVAGSIVTNSSASPAVLTVSSAAEITTFGGTIQNGIGAMSLTKSGDSTLILTGANIYTGATTINAGTLQLGDGVNNGSIVSTAIANQGTLAFNPAGTQTFAAPISGAGQVVKLGSGTQILTGAHSYTGATTISGGTLQIGDGTTDGKLSLRSTVLNNGTLAFHTVGSQSYGGVISGTGGLVKSGAGTQTLTGANTYGGPTTINGGTLQLGRVADSLIHRWSFNDTTDSVGDANLSLVNGASVGAGALTLNGVNQYAISSAVTGENLTAKTLVTWVTLNDLNQAGGGGALTVETVGGQVFDSIVYGEQIPTQWMAGSNGFLRTNDGPGGNGGGGESSNGPHMIAITYNTDNSITLYRDGVQYGSPYAKGTLENYSGAIDYIMGWRHFTGGGVSYLAGDIDENRVYNKVLSAGEISDLFAAGSNSINALANRLPTTTAVSLTAAGATLDLNGVNQTVASLAGASGSVVTSSFAASSKLTLSAATGATTYSGTIQNGAGIVSLTKAGGSTQVLDGANTYTGETIVEGGSLIVNGSLAGTARIDVQSGATLGGSGTLTLASGPTGDLNFLDGSKLAPGPTTGPGVLHSVLSGGSFDLTLAIDTETGALQFELASLAASDRVTITGGALTIGAGKLGIDDFTFTTLAGFGQGTYLLFDGTTAIDGTLDLAHLTGAIGAFSGTIGTADGGNDLVLNVVPEPTTALSLLAGLGILATRRRRSEAAGAR